MMLSEPRFSLAVAAVGRPTACRPRGQPQANNTTKGGHWPVGSSSGDGVSWTRPKD